MVKRRHTEIAFDTDLPTDFSAHGHLSTDDSPYSYNFFQCQNDVLKIMAKSKDFDVSKVVLSLSYKHDLTTEERKELYELFAQITRKTLRKTDQVFNKQHAQELDIILPGTRAEEAQIVIDKIRQQLSEAPSRNITSNEYAFSVESLHQKEVA